jgi:hypothetical protein
VSELITGARVVAVGYAASAPAGNVSFWIADQHGAMLVYNAYVPFDPSTLQPGDEVDLRVTEVDEFFGIPEITGIDLINVTSTGNPVWVVDAMDGSDVTFSAYESEVVEIWGELVTDPVDCGGFDCADLDVGSPNPVQLRLPAGVYLRGDCVHVIAPVGSFDYDTQINMSDFDWARFY